MFELSLDEPSIATAGTARTGELARGGTLSIVSASGEPRQKPRRRKVSTHVQLLNFEAGD